MDLTQKKGERGAAEAVDRNSLSIQDAFLNAARRDRLYVTIYLVSGVKLTGKIKSFDKYALVLEGGNQEQLIYKHAISTVVTQKMHLAHTAGQSQHTPAGSGEPPAGAQEV